MKKLARTFLRKCGLEINRYRAKDLRGRLVSLAPASSPKGNVLLSYRLQQFLLKKGQAPPKDHVTAWESRQIADIFLDMGYSVDVIYYEDSEFLPTKPYAFVVDVLSNIERLAPRLNSDCVKIFHVLWAHWLFNNAAEYRRLSDLRQRRGFVLKPRRQLQPNTAIDVADYATVIGNHFTLGTYKHAGKPLFPIPNSVLALYPWPEQKNFETSRKRFLWLGGAGAVHKGLDLVLEAFAAMPDCHLTVCGNIGAEEDFRQAFCRELYRTPNIQAVDFLDVASPEFTEIARNTCGLVYPSCSEGQAASVLTCMHSGVIPIVSRESGVDVGGFGINLEKCSIEEIKTSVQTLSALPASELHQRARAAWEYARASHTREKFTEAYKNSLSEIMDAAARR
jgi:glycosyltransferase involved in cell wall biosynthesis